MTDLVVASIISIVVALIVGLAYYLWYALALSAVFPKLGSPSWKGWVPIVNEVEILVLGGVPGWAVVFYFVPILNIYGLYLKVTAVHRINLTFGRGAGMTVLGILLPPVWASILAWGRGPAPEFDQRVASMLPSVDGVRVGPLSGGFPTSDPARPVSPDAGYGVPQIPSAIPTPPVSITPAPPERPIVALVPAPTVPDPTPPIASVPEPKPPLASNDEAASERPTPAPAFIVNPWAQPATESATTDATPVVPPPPVSQAPVVPAEPAAIDPVIVRDDAEDDAQIDGQDDGQDEDEYAATVVVDRRPRLAWSLSLDSGKSFPLTADRVALGRNPASEDSDAQLLPLPDSTRTLSKTHATIQLEDGEWTVTDLNSTNGVVVVGDDDAETLLAPGQSSRVPGRFILGKVGMRVVSDSGHRP